MLSLFVLLCGAVPEAEAEARQLYRNEADYEKRWPVEFHIRVLEPLTQEVARGLRDLELPEAKGVDLGEGRGFSAYLDAFDYIERATLSLKKGGVPRPGTFTGHAALVVAGRERTGVLRFDHGTVEMEFQRTANRWEITRFVSKDLTVQRGEQRRPYREITAAWLANVSAAARQRLLRSSASDTIHEAILSGKKVAPRLQPVAMDVHPGAVVVDLDQDGFDDLFVWDVLGKATLLRNVDGRHFAEQELGFENVSGAAFADLDDDGHLDLVLGAWFSRSRILFGSDDGFVLSDAVLPAEVVTISVADVNGDGRLDVFLGTAAHDHHARYAPEGADANMDQIGPKNALLINLGERRFEERARALGIDVARNTLQASFADYDDDGDMDLFLGNDFAPANLFENVGERFEDVSAAAGADRILFGMGASWGDVDGDGDLDLYASAMASSAGARIMSNEDVFADSLDALDRRRRLDAARGNTLLLNQGDRFVDGTAGPYAALRNANWSYGSLLFDADGDGRLDAYAPNGFFTSRLAPDEVFRDL